MWKIRWSLNYMKRMCESISWKIVAPMLNVEEDEVPKEVFCFMII
jgi:hypothetical protein